MAYRQLSKTAAVEIIQDSESATFFRRFLRQNLARNLRIGAFVSAIVLLINIIWLALGAAKYGIKNGYGVIRQDTCDSVKKTDIWLHLLINALSTCLQSATNMFVAAFCSPSRKEVDKAHVQREWLHVGAFSFRNLPHIAGRKAAIVICLLLTSIPFHLLYNSLVFTSLYTNSYVWSIANEDFLRGADFNVTGPIHTVVEKDKWNYYLSSEGPPEIPSLYFKTHDIGELYFGIDKKPYFLGENDTQIENWTTFFHDVQENAPSWERLNLRQCIQAYSNVVVSERRHVVSERRHVVLVSSTASSLNNSIFKWSEAKEVGDELDSNYWICSKKEQNGGYSRDCNPRKYLEKGSWNVWGHDIEYCLSETKPAMCKVQFSLNIMIVVIVFNLVKLSCMLLALTKFDAEHLLATTGDAVVSFLQEKDPTTAGLCLANLRNMKSMWKTPGFAQPYHAPKRWQEAVSRGRWVVFFIIMFIALAIVAVLHAWGLTWLRKNDYNLDFTSLWSLGLGTVSQYTMVISPNDLRDGPDLAKFAVLANLPQVVLALIYFTYSTILTTMFIAADWSRFAFRPQTLMVSNSINDRQRGMWALGTPWPYAIILITMQVLLHWLVSQSLFVAQVFRMELDTTPYPEPVILNCGYSPIAIMCSMIVAGVMLLGVGTLMFRKFPDGAPPVASTNSAAISAACHSNEIDDAAAFKPLRWGAWEGMSGGVGHCSLMPDDVYQQGVGKMAADGQTYT